MYLFLYACDKIFRVLKSIDYMHLRLVCITFMELNIEIKKKNILYKSRR